MKNPEYVYVSGPMTGKAGLNFSAFQKATRLLRKAGYKVCSPAELDGDSRQGMTWAECLRRDIIIMMQRCNKIVLLSGWFGSRGAKLEVFIAWVLGFEVHYVGYYLGKKR